MVSPMMDELKWQLLLDRIHQGRCVPFLGAGVNLTSEARNYQGLPLGGDLAKALARELLYEPEAHAQLNRLALEFQLRTDRPRLMERLRRELADDDVEPSPLLRTLALLPLRLIVTTNYDRLLERALRHRSYDVVVQPGEGFLDTPQVRERFHDLKQFAGIVVYKIHGTFAGPSPSDDGLDEDDQSTVIITEDDYIDFLTVHESDEARLGVPDFIRTRITPSTLLFLGYGLEDWDFRTIHRALVQNLSKHQQRTSIAIQRDPAQYWVKYWASLGVEIFDIDLYDFDAELRERYLARYPADVDPAWLSE